MQNNDAQLRNLRVRESLRFVPTPMTGSLQTRVYEFWEHAQDCLAGGGSRRRLFAIIGESGTGKTTALNWVLNEIEALKPHQNHSGEKSIPMVSMVIPRTCTTKDLAIRLLHELGQTASHKSNEDALYEAARTQLRASGTILLHLDEAQHLKKSSSDAAVKGLQDRFKSLLAIPDWPLHLILSGVEELAELFTGDQQLANRSLVMRFERLNYPGDKDFVEGILSDIANGNCGLSVPAALRTDDFLGRLVNATGGGVGTMIEMIRAASFKALSKGHSHIDPRDFAFVYGRISGGRPDDNIMKAAAWRDIDRRNALVDLVPQSPKRKSASRRAAR